MELGRVSFQYSGGLLWYNDDRRRYAQHVNELGMLATREAEVKAAPLREVLDDFDFDSLAQNTLRAGLGKSAWFKAEPLELKSNPSPASRFDFAQIAPTQQVAFASCFYYFSHDFTRVEVLVDLSMMRKVKGKKKPELFYFHRLTSVVELPQRSHDERVNVRTWSADKGKLARAAFAAAFARMEKMIPRALDLTKAEVTGYNAPGGDLAQRAGRYGPVLERGQDGPASLTLWSKGLISVQPAVLPAS